MMDIVNINFSKTTELKYCPSCKHVYPVSFFGRNIHKQDGYSSYCKECYREKANKYYNDHAEDILKQRAEKNGVKMFISLKKMKFDGGVLKHCPHCHGFIYVDPTLSKTQCQKCKGEFNISHCTDTRGRRGKGGIRLWIENPHTQNA
jgi:uncharacterized protein YbaR (Trm112 family)